MVFSGVEKDKTYILDIQAWNVLPSNLLEGTWITF